MHLDMTDEKRTQYKWNLEVKVLPFLSTTVVLVCA